MKHLVIELLRCLYYPLKRHYDFWGYRSFVKDTKIKVKDTMTTIDYILRTKCSVSRFGDGEFRVMNNYGNGFQTPNRQLAERLKEVLHTPQGNHIVCLPYVFMDDTILTNAARSFWYPFCTQYHQFIKNVINKNRTYYDTNFTRFYMDMRNKSRVQEVVCSLKKIWQDRNIYIVEGEYSRLGIGNDLFENAKSIHRILAPSKNAFEKYEQILDATVKNVPKDGLVLVALGMTATVLCYDLAKMGFQAIDIGHIDIEYSWFMMGASKKCPVPGKAVNEVGVMPREGCVNDSYTQSIISIIK